MKKHPMTRERAREREREREKRSAKHESCTNSPEAGYIDWVTNRMIHCVTSVEWENDFR